MRRFLLLAACLGTCVCSGCTLHSDPWNTPIIPWWKGIPTQILAPNSLEAEMWRVQQGARRAEHRAAHEGAGESVPTPSAPDMPVYVE